MTIDARTMCLMGLLIAIAALPPRSNRRPLLPARTPITRNRIRRRLRSCRRRRSSCRMYPTTGTISRRTTAAGSRCASASSPSSTTARFHKASEHRPYDKTVWYARRIVPRGKWGAWEVVGRYSHIDVADRTIEGGVFNRETVGLAWWATRRWRLSVDYGFIDLNRTGISGVTKAVHTRLQWMY